MKSRKLKKIKVNSAYTKLALANVIAVYFLILVGGIVRSTGSGMGCPDWPKCFGQYIPPTDQSELPVNYKEIYAAKRIQKNERFASLLEQLGASNAALKIRNDESIQVEDDFNAIKTWIEYINRLIGAIIGLLILALFLFSFRYIKVHPKIVIIASLTFILVLFQAWIGSIVVSTNLTTWMISIHMMLAILIVFLLILIFSYAFPMQLPHFDLKAQLRIKWLLIVGICLMLVQIILGTQVRESIDLIAKEFDYSNRNLWIGELGLSFYIHRSFSLLILLIHLYTLKIIWPYRTEFAQFRNFVYLLTAIVFAEILSGTMMSYFGIPAFLQPVHLLLGTLIIGFQFFLLRAVNINSNVNVYA